MRATIVRFVCTEQCILHFPFYSCIVFDQPTLLFLCVSYLAYALTVMLIVPITNTADIWNENMTRLVTWKCTYRYESSLIWEVRWSTAESKSGLQSVERCLQLAFLLELRWLVLAAVLTELFQPTLCHLQCTVARPVFQPRTRLLNPLQQLQIHTHHASLYS